MNDFFKDLKIVELANVLAGPAVGTFFSELGAEVIKIENKLTGGDVTRSWKLPSENKALSTSAYFASVNYNKKSLFLNLTDNKDKERVYSLIKEADIVISNFKPGDDKKFGLDYFSLKSLQPNIILAHLTGFGEEVHRTAYDLILQAETGYMYMNGNPESGPLKMPVALIDILAAHQMKEAILIALIKKLKTGKGSKITVSLFDAAISSLSNQACNWLMAGHNPQPIGSLHPNIAPYGELFATKDGKRLVLAIGSNKQFIRLCQILNLNELTNDERFVSNVNRVKNRTVLFNILHQTICQFESKNLIKNFIQNDVPAGIIKSVKDVFLDESIKSKILTDFSEKQEINKRIKTVIFELSD